MEWASIPVSVSVSVSVFFSVCLILCESSRVSLHLCLCLCGSLLVPFLRPRRLSLSVAASLSVCLVDNREFGSNFRLWWRPSGAKCRSQVCLKKTPRHVRFSPATATQWHGPAHLGRSPAPSAMVHGDVKKPRRMTACPDGSKETYAYPVMFTFLFLAKSWFPNSLHHVQWQKGSQRQHFQTALTCRI